MPGTPVTYFEKSHWKKPKNTNFRWSNRSGFEDEGHLFQTNTLWIQLSVHTAPVEYDESNPISRQIFPFDEGSDPTKSLVDLNPGTFIEFENDGSNPISRQIFPFKEIRS